MSVETKLGFRPEFEILIPGKNLIKTTDYSECLVHGFGDKLKIFTSAKSIQKHISRGEKDAIFILIAPSSKLPQFRSKPLTIAHDFGRNDTKQKNISRGVEWCKFQVHSTFQ